ncbi:unnamed protein product [Wuchereria bancrofti]|uniref:Uncharacterized protein n=1 Tax=Wuchereria bancrofti TaxID=6293 RepID=A0A3P7FC73_WUCBA|nr:unnamed protein product [Wuchereria bancrofti]
MYSSHPIISPDFSSFLSSSNAEQKKYSRIIIMLLVTAILVGNDEPQKSSVTHGRDDITAVRKLHYLFKASLSAE